MFGSRKRNSKGFTIVELLIVVIVISILASITIVSYRGMTARANDSQRDAAVATIKKGLEMYRMENGTYPPCGNLNVDCNVSWLDTQIVPKYIEKLPLIKGVSGQPSPKFFNNGNTTTYTLFVPYESKSGCKTGVNPSTTYQSAYPVCS